MNILKMEVVNFRNYSSSSFVFSAAANILFGDNGQGKTNILEAIHTIATTKSFRTSNIENLLKTNEKNLRIICEISKNNVFKKVKFNLEPKSKSFFVNEKRAGKISDILGIINAIVFCPEDIMIIKGDASQRRRFIDVALCQVDKIYLVNLIEYQRILRNKSALLKVIKFDRTRCDEIDLWNEQLVMRAEVIYAKRLEFIESINKENQRLAKYLSGNRENVELVYLDNVLRGRVEKGGVYRDVMLERLKSSQQEEIKKGINLVGTHKDELNIMMNGKNIREVGSQGQQRTVAITLRLAEVEYMFSVSGEYPILLIDDIFSELDDKRKAHFMELLDKETQMFLTGTRIEEFPNLVERAKVFKITEGQIEIYGK